MSDTRFPYTYACDAIRGVTERDENGGVKLSRSEASQIMALIAKALGHENHEFIATAIACEFTNMNPQIFVEPSQ